MLALLSDFMQSFRYPDHTTGRSHNYFQALIAIKDWVGQSSCPTLPYTQTNLLFMNQNQLSKEERSIPLGLSYYREEQNMTTSRLLFYSSHYFTLASVFAYTYSVHEFPPFTLSICFPASKSA
jgi:hypothetical protein